jgi:hypothetical protein
MGGGFGGPPPPPPMGGAPPPPPAPTVAAAPPERKKLLGDIQNGRNIVKLKKTQTNDRSSPLLTGKIILCKFFFLIGFSFY